MNLLFFLGVATTSFDKFSKVLKFITIENPLSSSSSSSKLLIFDSLLFIATDGEINTSLWAAMPKKVFLVVVVVVVAKKFKRYVGDVS